MTDEGTVMDSMKKRKPNFIVIGLGFGLCFGAIIGVAVDNIPAGLAIGPGAGLAIGALISATVRKNEEKDEG
jgi:hypothetical protein